MTLDVLSIAIIKEESRTGALPKLQCAYTLRMFIAFLHIGVTHRHLSDHMSDMVENTLNDLEQSKVQYACQLIIDTELSTL